MKHFPLLDNPEFAVVGVVALLDIPSMGIDQGWIELASRLTVSGILLIGLYFLNKMKEASEAKREQALKALIANTDKANEALKGVYEARISDLSRQLSVLDNERKELQNKLIDK